MILRHKSELESLKTVDPDFYQYLQENDANLLDFEGEEDDDMEDDLDELEQDENDLAGEEDEEEDEVEYQEIEVTEEYLQEITTKAKKGSVSDLKRLSAIFKAATQPFLEEDEEEKESNPNNRVKYIISSAEIYEIVMTQAIDSIHKAISSILQISTPITKVVIQSLASNKKWKKVHTLILSFYKILINNLNSLGLHGKHNKVLIYFIDCLEHYIPFLSPLPRLTKSVIKILLNLWSGSLNDNLDTDDLHQIRGHAFLRLRQIAIQLPGTNTEDCFRFIYLKFARCCKNLTETNLSNILYLTNCVVELYKLDIAVAYQQAFMYIRQLALHLRNAYLKKGETYLKPIKSWQFVNCLKLWTRVLCAMPSTENGLGMLAFPFIQILFGSLSLFPSSYYFPYRFHLIQMIQQVASACKLFAPTVFLLGEILESAELFSKPTPSTENSPKLQFLLAFPTNSLSKAVVRDVVVQEALFLIRQEAEIYRYHIGFPEFIYLTIRKLKTFLKKIKVSKWKDSTRTILGTLQQYSEFVKSERPKLNVSPMAISEFEPLLPLKTPNSYDRLIGLQKFNVYTAPASTKSNQNVKTNKNQKVKFSKDVSDDESSNENEEVEMEDISDELSDHDLFSNKKAKKNPKVESHKLEDKKKNKKPKKSPQQLQSEYQEEDDQVEVLDMDDY